MPDFLPRREADLVSFGLNIKTRITATPLLFSLSASQASQFGTYYDTFVSAFNITRSDATNSKSATITKNTAKTAMISYLRVLAGIVQKAPTTTDTMRSDLGLNVPKVPSHPGNPGTPYKFKAALTANGALDLVWKCTSPVGGTVYQVWRTIDAGETTYVGGSGNKKFTDSNVPAGASKVTYEIQGVRPSAKGAWAKFEVQFGVAPGGTIQLVKQSPTKIAA